MAGAGKQEMSRSMASSTGCMTARADPIRACAQADIDQWLSDGTSGRWAICTFIVLTTNDPLSANLVVRHRPINSSRLLIIEERLRLLRRSALGGADGFPPKTRT